MVPLLELWLAILACALVVFVASAAIHMAPLWHKGDYPAVPDQDRVMELLRPLAIPPGDYMVPRAADMRQMQSAEFVEKFTRGPVMMMTVLPNGPVSMNRSLALWFGYVLVVSIFTAYVSGRALPGGAPAMDVVQVAATTAFMGYVLAIWQMSIWYNRGWSLTIKETVDGGIYALLTAAVLAGMWPAS